MPVTLKRGKRQYMQPLKTFTMNWNGFLWSKPFLVFTEILQSPYHYYSTMIYFWLGKRASNDAKTGKGFFCKVKFYLNQSLSNWKAYENVNDNQGEDIICIKGIYYADDDNEAFRFIQDICYDFLVTLGWDFLVPLWRFWFGECDISESSYDRV